MRKELEKLAREKGVVLAPVAKVEASEPARPAPPGKGFIRTYMPAAAALLLELRDQIGAELWRGAMDNLKKGRGTLIDFQAGYCIGKPLDEHPVQLPGAERDGYSVKRLKRQVLQGGAPEPQPGQVLRGGASDPQPGQVLRGGASDPQPGQVLRGVSLTRAACSRSM